MIVIGIDPSLNDTAVAALSANADGIRIVTRHIEKLIAGTYTAVIKSLTGELIGSIVDSEYAGAIIHAGFVEDFSNIGGPDTKKTTIKSVSHSGGMAEEAIAALGIPMMPITVREWRKVALGVPAPHPTKSGKMLRYWTKGDSAFKLPGNLQPALIGKFGAIMGFTAHGKPRYDKFKPKDGRQINYLDSALEYMRMNYVTSRRIQLVFGISLDELEAAAIAFAGYWLIKDGKIEGLRS